MEEQRKGEGKVTKLLHKKEKPKVTEQLSVTLYDTGQCQITGPVNDKMRFYGLLGVALELMVKRGSSQDAEAAQVKGSLKWWQRIVKHIVP